MELLKEIETLKYSILDTLYPVLPSTLFTPTNKFIHPKYNDLCILFKRFERACTSANTQWWDRYFLEKYHSTHISPRGLRILKDCSFLDQPHEKEWLSIAEFCTQKWISIIIEQRTIKYDAAVHLVQILSDDILKLTNTLPDRWLNTLKQNTKHQEDILIRTKLRKFKRDIDDYNHNKVFTWKRKNENSIPSLLHIDPWVVTITSNRQEQPTTNRPRPSNNNQNNTTTIDTSSVSRRNNTTTGISGVSNTTDTRKVPITKQNSNTSHNHPARNTSTTLESNSTVSPSTSHQTIPNFHTSMSHTSHNPTSSNSTIPSTPSSRGTIDYSTVTGAQLTSDAALPAVSFLGPSLFPTRPSKRKYTEEVVGDEEENINPSPHSRKQRLR